MKYMGAAEFKAKCLRVMEQVAESGEAVAVTKRGTPVVHVVPSPPVEPHPPYWGSGAGTFVVLGDIVGPMDTTGWAVEGVPWSELHPEDARRHSAAEQPAETPRAKL